MLRKGCRWVWKAVGEVPGSSPWVFICHSRRCCWWQPRETWYNSPTPNWGQELWRESTGSAGTSVYFQIHFPEPRAYFESNFNKEGSFLTKIMVMINFPQRDPQPGKIGDCPYFTLNCGWDQVCVQALMWWLLTKMTQGTSFLLTMADFLFRGKTAPK